MDEEFKELEKILLKRLEKVNCKTSTFKKETEFYKGVADSLYLISKKLGAS